MVVREVVCYLHLGFQQLHILCCQPRHIHDRRFVHSLCQHLPGYLKASLGHAFGSSFFLTFLVSVVQESSFNTYSVPKLVVGTEFGIRESGYLQFIYGFPYLRVIKQVGWNLFRIGIYFREETEP